MLDTVVMHCPCCGAATRTVVFFLRKLDVDFGNLCFLNSLVWQDSYYQYSLYGSFSSVAELMKIAEGIKTE